MTASGGSISGLQGALLAALLLALGLTIGYSLRQHTTSAAPGVPPPLLQRRATPASGPSANRFHQAPCPPPRQPGTERRNLVFAAVGDSWAPDRWSFSDQAGWDLVAVYYGNRSDWGCPQCTRALHMPGSMKWQMLWTLMEADSSSKGSGDGESNSGGGGGKKAGVKSKWAGIWKELRSSYEYVMVADDDLIMDACTIDLFFASMKRHSLLAAQPSNCRGNDSDNPYWVHWQLPGLELHYVNIIEVTAPGLDMKFLDKKMRPYLEHTFSGWGLPFCFWAAAGFPTQRLAAIDAACMIHPTRKDVGEKMSVSERIRRGLVKPGSIYARFAELTPFESPKAEQLAVWKECGYEEPPPSHRGRHFFILGTELAAPQAAAAQAGAALAAGFPPTPQEQQDGQQKQQQQGEGQQDEQQQRERQQFAVRQQMAAAEALRGQPWQNPLVLVGMLVLAAGVGAAAALQCDRRTRDGQQLPMALATRSRSSSPPRNRQ